MAISAFIYKTAPPSNPNDWYYWLATYNASSPNRVLAEGYAYNECLRGKASLHQNLNTHGDCSGAWVRYGWVAIASSGEGTKGPMAWAARYGHTFAAARDSAISGCENEGGKHCTLTAWQGTGGYPVNGANVTTTGGTWQT